MFMAGFGSTFENAVASHCFGFRDRVSHLTVEAEFSQIWPGLSLAVRFRVPEALGHRVKEGC